MGPDLLLDHFASSGLNSLQTLIHSFLALTLSINWVSVKPPPCVVDRWVVGTGQLAASLEDRKVLLLSLGQGIMVNKDVITITVSF